MNSDCKNSQIYHQSSQMNSSPKQVPNVYALQKQGSPSEQEGLEYSLDLNQYQDELKADPPGSQNYVPMNQEIAQYIRQKYMMDPMLQIEEDGNESNLCSGRDSNSIYPKKLNSVLSISPRPAEEKSKRSQKISCVMTGSHESNPTGKSQSSSSDIRELQPIGDIELQPHHSFFDFPFDLENSGKSASPYAEASEKNKTIQKSSIDSQNHQRAQNSRPAPCLTLQPEEYDFEVKKKPFSSCRHMDSKASLKGPVSPSGFSRTTLNDSNMHPTPPSVDRSKKCVSRQKPSAVEEPPSENKAHSRKASTSSHKRNPSDLIKDISNWVKKKQRKPSIISIHDRDARETEISQISHNSKEFINPNKSSSSIPNTKDRWIQEEKYSLLSGIHSKEKERDHCRASKSFNQKDNLLDSLDIGRGDSSSAERLVLQLPGSSKSKSKLGMPDFFEHRKHSHQQNLLSPSYHPYKLDEKTSMLEKMLEKQDKIIEMLLKGQNSNSDIYSDGTPKGKNSFFSSMKEQSLFKMGPERNSSDKGLFGKAVVQSQHFPNLQTLKSSSDSNTLMENLATEIIRLADENKQLKTQVEKLNELREIDQEKLNNISERLEALENDKKDKPFSEMKENQKPAKQSLVVTSPKKLVSPSKTNLHTRRSSICSGKLSAAASSQKSTHNTQNSKNTQKTQNQRERQNQRPRSRLNPLLSDSTSLLSIPSPHSKTHHSLRKDIKDIKDYNSNSISTTPKEGTSSLIKSLVRAPLGQTGYRQGGKENRQHR